jgi:hypothetical protein
MFLSKIMPIFLLIALPLSAKNTIKTPINLDNLGYGDIAELLPIAAKLGQEKLIKKLLNEATHWPELKINQEKLDEALCNACNKGMNESTINALLKAGANPNARTFQGCPALYIATLSGKIETIRTLLNYGADINIRCHENYNRTPLMCAAEYCNKGVVSLLLSYKANVNLQDKNGATALLLSINSEKNIDVIKQLLHAGADKNIANSWGLTPLKKACEYNKRCQRDNIVNRNGHLEILKLLS